MNVPQVESAVNSQGDAAMFVRPLAAAPTAASIVGRRVTLLGVPGEPAFRISREAARAARIRGRLLVVEIVADRVARDTAVALNGKG